LIENHSAIGIEGEWETSESGHLFEELVEGWSGITLDGEQTGEARRFQRELEHCVQVVGCLTGVRAAVAVVVAESRWTGQPERIHFATTIDVKEPGRCGERGRGGGGGRRR